MKVHLRLTEKDVDLCRWRHSIKHGMMTYYVGQILLAEAQGKIAYLPTAFDLSEKKDPCDVYMVFTLGSVFFFTMLGYAVNGEENGKDSLILKLFNLIFCRKQKRGN